MADVELRLRLHQMTWRRVEDSIIVLDLDNSTYLSVNGTGAVIWEQLVHGATVASMVRSVTDQFDVDATVAEADIKAFTEDLRARRFLD
jgi:Coenzyme PQQ synthesis protein D (PqqD)